jgi:hypothetical protein
MNSISFAVMSLKALLGGFEHTVEIGRARVRKPAERLLGRGIDHILAGTSVAVEPLAVNVERKVGVHGLKPRYARE